MHEENKRKKISKRKKLINLMVTPEEYEIIDNDSYRKKAPYVTKILIESLSAFKKSNQFSITMTFDYVPVNKEELTLMVQLSLDKDTYDYLYKLSKATKISISNLVRYFVIPNLPKKDVDL